MPNLVGTGLNQVPTNSMLGGLAYQDPEHASIKDLDLKNLSQINSEITGTAVDVFVYDTRKDSDGGAWRKRTQHTSWYNETLNTSTRGSRKEFPAVAVIVSDASSDKVTIYDGDDPDLPMWMVISGANPRGILGWATSNITTIKVTALNGIIVLGTNDSGTIFKFVEDFVEIMYSSANYDITSSRTIAGRNDTPSYNIVSGTASRVFVIVTYAINDVAMTVLPNAPIDDATGLPIPTIAVATNSGVSVIKDDGTVFDITSPSTNDAVGNIALDNQYVYFTSPDSGAATEDRMLFVYKIPSGDISNSFGYNDSDDYLFTTFPPSVSTPSTPSLAIHNSSSEDIVDMVVYDKKIFSALPSGLAYLDEYSTTTLGGSVAYATTSYNTGWMHGDIKGAFLSDTDTTNVTGSEKIANYNFAADFSTQWEVKNNANTSYDATNDRVTVTSTQNYSGIRLKSASLPTLTNGKRYIMTVDIHSITNSIRFGVVSGGTKDSVNSTGSHQLMFTAGASISEVFVEKPTGSNSTFVLNSVSIREAEEDRSVNNKGLQVHGTVNKSAVATGAELVGYDNFGNSNYLEQPYNTDLNFGTGDFSLMNWIYVTAGGDYQVVFDRWSPTGGNARFYWGLETSERLYFHHREDSSSNATDLTGSTVLSTGVWHHMAAVRRGTSVEVYLNGKLDNSTTSSIRNVTPGSTQPTLRIGTNNVSSPSDPMLSKLALLRISGSAPSAEQIKKIYEDEKCLFHENSKATLYGSSDDVTALDYDDSTNLLYAGTSAGRSDFQGLRRINNTTTAVTTAISASNGLIAEQ